ncbi:TonB-dependent receptor domain-containing protein [Aurantiacibacter poecillastricola]|uniref:TonB-dependent receptor domain-containing protein n=1 Tax=Aurantiacibacter poecillastricola TaxID=3064385 RepID=UPI00273FB446|nr:TonB-dependent receptor [Aurantiacibacter sp. 219JJ12-13]MDP5260036.1 TonB-dependent receptor [Aurantiacibacter sp. 219JJ12-13]
MTTGKKLAGLLLLTTALSMPGIALAQGTQGSTGAASGSPTAADDDAGDLLQDVEGLPGEAEGEYEDPDISVPGGSIIVTGRVNRNPERSSTQVVNVLSSEQIARTGEGDIAGALSRVTGLSVVGNGLVYVRGLGDRYSLALLNGLPLPSPEPLSRVVPLDIFPTNVVASSLVQKTYSPNFPGEFGGGVINLTTRAVPDETFVKISGGISGDTETTFQNGYAYYGSEMDWTGFDSGARDIPPAVQSFLDDSFNNGTQIELLDQEQVEGVARFLTPPLFSTLQILGDIRPNFSAGLTAGTALDVGSDGRLGIVATSSLSNSWRNRVISRQEAGPNSPDISDDESDFVTDNNILFNALVGLGLEVGDHTFRFTNLFIRDTVKQASLASFTRPAEFPSFDFLEQNTSWFERQLIDSQLVAELEFDRLSVDLRGGFARTDREAPFNLTYVYGRDSDPPDTIFGDLLSEYAVDLGQQVGSGFQETGVEVVFSDLYEELWYGGIDLSYELADTFTVTTGYAYSDTDRFSERRGFTFDVDIDPNFLRDPDLVFGGNGNPNAITSLQQILFAAGLRTPANLLNATTYNLFDVGLIDQNLQDPAFEAELTIHAGYVQGQLLALDDTLTVQGGVRYEDADQSTTPLGAANPSVGQTILKSDDYWLPALTVTWEPIEDLQIRANGSRTLARPQFRELVQQRYFDPETNRQYAGNPFLTDSELTNAELRLEYYLGGQSSVSVAGFYKDISDPIEVYITPEVGSDFINYANAPGATLYGAEVDLQYSFDLFNLGGFFESKELIFLANYTYTNSEISVGPEDTIAIANSDGTVNNTELATNYFTDGDPLVGQSDHLVNLQVGIEDLDRLQQLTVLVSYASDRVTLRGSNGLSDVVQEPGVNLDLVFRQGFELAGTDLELKLEARNLLGTDHKETQTNNTGLVLQNNSYDVGQSFAASLSVEF